MTTIRTSATTDFVSYVPCNVKSYKTFQPLLKNCRNPFTVFTKYSDEVFATYSEDLQDYCKNQFEQSAVDLFKVYCSDISNIKCKITVSAYLNGDIYSNPIVRVVDGRDTICAHYFEAWNDLRDTLVEIDPNIANTYLIYASIQYFDMDTGKLITTRLESKVVTHNDILKYSRKYYCMVSYNYTKYGEFILDYQDIIMVDNVKPAGTALIIHVYPTEDKVYPSVDLYKDNTDYCYILKTSLYFRALDNSMELPRIFKGLGRDNLENVLGCKSFYCMKNIVHDSNSKVFALRNTVVFAVHSKDKLTSIYEDNDRDLHYHCNYSGLRFSL